MKKIILSAIAVCAFGFANAQDKGGTGLASGNIVLAGDVAYATSSQGDVKASGMVLSPGLGYMMSDNLMLLGQVGISSGSSNSGAAGAADVKTSGLDLTAGVRYFFTPADSFSLSLGGEITSGSSKDGDLKTNTLALNVPVGLHYFMNDHFAVNASWGGLGYSSEKEDVAGAEARTTLGLGLNMSSVSFGLLYKL
jgi:outer membrane protein